MKRLFFVLLFLLPIFTMAKHVAVLETLADPVAKDVVKYSDQIFLTDELRKIAIRELPASQNFTIMTRESFNDFIEPGKTLEQCESEASCIVDLGRMLQADFVAQARVGSFNGELTLAVELYDTHSKKLLASITETAPDLGTLRTIIQNQAPAFFRSAKKGESGWGGATGFSDISSGGSFSVKGKKSFIVDVATTPAGAALSIDGRPVPKCMQTPCRIQVEEGEHLFVAVMDRYDDGEIRATISAENKIVNMDLTPNFGTLVLEPKLDGNLGTSDDIYADVDGKFVKPGNISLDPGIHEVRVSHPCYDPIVFKVGIQKMATEVFNGSLVRGIGGLKLEAEWNGEPQALPVYIDGVEAGSTPFLGEVPLCAKVTVGEDGKYEDVNVDLKWHETVELTHKLKNKPASEAMDEDAAKPQVGESIPTNVEPEPSGIKWVPVGISAAVAVAGTVLAIVGNSKAKSVHDEKPADAKEYKKNKDDIHSAQTMRTVGIVTAIVGAIGIGVSFAF